MTTLIQSYVFRDGKCFFVSTIDRDSSSLLGGRYAETMAWEIDPATKQRGELIGQGECVQGFIGEHQRACLSLYQTGEYGERT